MTPRLAAYLRRIGYAGSLDCTHATLCALHRAHLLAIPYENLDVQFGVPLSLDSGAAFEKIVLQRRGGWCYEMNSLFAWALREIGFEISLIAAAVGRKDRGEAAERNHLAILVHLDKAYLADVGFGNGFIAPLPLAEGTHSDGRFEFALQRVDEGWWRFTNRPQSGDTFDFRETPHSIDAFDEQNQWLQSSPQSPFVRALVCHRFTEEGVITLRGCVLTTLTPHDLRQEVVQSRDDLATILRTQFSLDTPHVDALWERVSAGPQALAQAMEW
jgi:N-hydroxyarylamine O-acetyltransferase